MRPQHRKLEALPFRARGDVDDRQRRARLRPGAVVRDDGRLPVARDGDFVRPVAGGDLRHDGHVRRIDEGERGVGFVQNEQCGQQDCAHFRVVKYRFNHCDSPSSPGKSTRSVMLA